MAARPPLHKALASDDSEERRSGMFQLLLLLDDRIAHLSGLRDQVEIAIGLMDKRNLGRVSRETGEGNGRRVSSPAFVAKPSPSAEDSILALIAGQSEL